MPQKIGKNKFSLKHEQAQIPDRAIDQIADADQYQRKFDVIIEKHPVECTVQVTDHSIDQCVKPKQPSPEQIHKKTAYKPYSHTAVFSPHESKGSRNHNHQIRPDIRKGKPSKYG